MKACFADTHFYLALLSETDEAHDRALAMNRTLDATMVTTEWVLTEWVLTEVADAMSTHVHRGLFLELMDALEVSSGVLIVPATHELFMQGLGLYQERMDKNWSLTDCISFVVMAEQGIREALTADRHFEQAGFLALLK